MSDFPPRAIPVQFFMSLLCGLTEKNPFPPRPISLFGVTPSGAPAVLRLDDPLTGALLVTGKRNSTSALLQTVCHSALALNGHQAGVAVITSRPQDWDANQRMSLFSDSTPLEWIMAFIQERAEGIILLLVEDYELIEREIETFRVICAHGPARKVWTICTAEPQNNIPGWLFPTRITETSQPRLFRMGSREGQVFFSVPDGG
jgi:hypothetical protein